MKMCRLPLCFGAILVCSLFAISTSDELIAASSVQLPSSCYEALQETRRSGVYLIQVPALSAVPFHVYCNDDEHLGGWTVIQRRIDGEVNFDRMWNEYKRGFGDLRADFFIGLDKLHAMTASGVKQELLIILRDEAGVKKTVKYNEFAIGNEAQSYILNKLGNKYGDTSISDSLSYHMNREFATRDHNSGDPKCPVSYPGGWWFRSCMFSQLNGRFGAPTWSGIAWMYFDKLKDWSTLTYAEMLIRPTAQFRETIN